jgi:hypothetical protein
VTTRDALAELDAILDQGRRAPGSDAERRTAVHLARRLRGLGRSADVEPFAVYPAWPFAHAVLAAAAAGASVLAVYLPLAGAALALAAAVLTYLDAAPVRRLLGRRASQNVVSLSSADRAAALVLVAHVDAGKGGLVHSEATARRLARLPVGGLQLLLAAELAVLACALIRLAGVDSDALTVVQLVPTAALLVALALLLDVALAGTRGGENDNASGLVVVLGVAERLGEALEHFAVHVVFTGAGTAGAAGMRAFAKRHDLDRASTVVLNVDRVGSGELRHGRRGHPQLVALCDDLPSVAEQGASDASATRLPSITITCREAGGHASGRVEEEALLRTEDFCLELAEHLDAELGPRISSPA